MRKYLVLAVLMLALVAMPAYASVQNVKISGGINSMFVHRANWDFGANTAGDEVQDVFLTRTKLRVDANLTDNVDAVIGLINERVWDDQTDSNTDIDLNEAYVTLREMLYSPLTVIVGRQRFAYGNKLIIGNGSDKNSDWIGVVNELSAQEAWDAIRMILDYDPLTIEMFYSKANAAANTVAFAANGRDDIEFYGINTSYDVGDSMNTQVESYFFAKYDKRNSDLNDNNIPNDTVYVPGIRVSTNPLEGLNLQGEIALQKGTRSSTTVSNQQKRDAYAYQFMSTYAVPVLEEYNPVVSYNYTLLSGDADPSSVDNGAGAQASGETWTGWDPMAESQAGGMMINGLFSYTGCQVHTVALQANPIEDVTTKFMFTGLYLDKRSHLGSAGSLTTVMPDSSTPGTVIVADEKHLGNEFDLATTWNYTEDVKIGANLGMFIPGKAFNGNNKKTATQAIFNVDMSF